MEKSALTEILKTFSKKDMKAFGAFVDSPYFNTSASTTGFFHALKKFYPAFESTESSKHEIFSEVYPAKKFSEELYRKNISNLIKLSEEFMTQQKIKELKYYKNNFTLNALLDRKLHKVYEKRITEYEKDFFANNLIDENYYSILHRQNITKVYFNLQKNDFNEYLKEYEITANFFTIGFLNFLFKTYSQIVNFRNIFGYKESNPLLNTFIENFDFIKFSKGNTNFDEWGEKIVKMYYHNYKMLLQPDKEENYFLYKELFYEVYSKISRAENFNLFLNLESYCSLKLNAGKEEYQQELMDVYNKMFELEMYSFNENEPLPLMQFRNISQVSFRAASAKEYEKTMNICLSKIDKAEIENYSRYAGAMIAFRKNDFNETLMNLRELDLNYFGFKTDCRNLQIMAYYELGHFESAISMIDSYKHFLAQSKDVNNILKTGCVNFLQYFSKLMKLKLKPDEHSILNLQKQLKASQGVFNKWWLLNKLEELNA
jgi:hypothetical protein